MNPAPTPLHATDTYSGDHVALRTLELLKVAYPALSKVTADFSQESAYFNQPIRTRIVTPPAVAAYHPVNGYVAQPTATEDVPVVINHHVATTVSFNANEMASTGRRLFDEQLEAQHNSIGKEMVAALYALITAENFTADPTICSPFDFDRATVIALGQALTARGVPAQGRTLLLNSEYYARLMADPAIVTLAAHQRPEIITGAQLPNVHGFDVIEAPDLPGTGNLGGFAFSRSALLLATRTPQDANKVFPGVQNGRTRVVTNPDTGLSVLLIQATDPILGRAFQAIAVMYGVAVGQSAAGQLLLSAAA